MNNLLDYKPPRIDFPNINSIKPLWNKDGSQVGVDGLEDYYTERFPNKFDFVVPFKEEFFKWMRGYKIPKKYRINKSLDDFEILAFDSKYKKIVESKMRTLTEICNVHPYTDHESRFRYQKLVIDLMEIHAEKSFKRFKKEEIFILEPLRAGALAGIVYNVKDKYRKRGIFKRLPKKDGGTWTGISGLDLSNIERNSALIVAECCTGSGATVVSLMLYLKEKSIKPKVIEVHSINSPMHSGIFILKAAEELGFKVCIKTASIGFWENDKLYNMRIGDEWSDGVYFVCDAGDFSIPLPKEFNKRAWWNKRRVYKKGLLD